MEQKINDFMALVEAKNPNEPEFLQAVREFAETVMPFIANEKKYDGKNVLLRMAEPERSIIFRVPWVDDKGEIQVNRVVKEVLILIHKENQMQKLCVFANLL